MSISGYFLQIPFILLQTIFLFNIISWIARDGVESDLDKDFTY